MLTPKEHLCLPGSVIDSPDERVIERFERYKGFRLDPGYKQILPSIHGGVPRLAYFKTEEGVVRRIGRFLTFLDEHSALSGPPQSTRDDIRVFDQRVYDLCIPYITDCDPDFFFSAERIVPFAALFTQHPFSGLIDPNDQESSLHNADLPILDTVCFDRSTTPHAIVVCDGNVAAWISDECDPDKTVDYDAFTHKVAPSFSIFISMLSATPPESGMPYS